ncbi:hypothetical protein ACFGVR_03210 [Mucilaginibacter sp. AW1-3]
MKIKQVIRRAIVTAFFVLAGFIVANVINILIGDIIIGDPEAYDTDGIKTGPVFNLFYEISSNTGYHPEPSIFNGIFVTVIGVALGGWFAYRHFKRTAFRATGE